MNLLSFFVASVAVHGAIMVLPINPFREWREELTPVTLYFEAEPADPAVPGKPKTRKSEPTQTTVRAKHPASARQKVAANFGRARLDEADVSSAPNRFQVDEKSDARGPEQAAALTTGPLESIESPANDQPNAVALEEEVFTAAAVPTLANRAAPGAPAETPKSESADWKAHETTSGARYAHTPPPQYPERAKKAGWQGTVLLQVSVDSAGTPIRVEVDRSSGFEVLDEAARQSVRNWRFHPARIGALPIQSTVRIPIVFELLDDRN